MPSPFPGMDPWLEEPGLFPSLHSALIYLILEALNAQLPDNYLATTDRMVAVAADPILEPWEQPYLEILSNDGERLVTAIEILSPSNKKPGDNGRTSYLQKQGEFRLANVNLIEIDLLRGGIHTTAIPIERQFRQSFCVCRMIAILFRVFAL